MISRGSILQSRRAAGRVGGLLLSTVIIFLSVALEGRAAAADASAAAQNSYAAVVSRVTPAVVTIRASRPAREARQFPFFDDPFFREFFGERFRQQIPRAGSRYSAAWVRG